MYVKLTCIIGIFINFLFHIFKIFCMLFRAFFHVLLFFSLVIILLLCVFVNILHVSRLFFTNSNYCNLLLGSAFFHVHIDIGKPAGCLQSNNNDSLNDFGLLFSTLLFSRKFVLITEATLC